LVDLGNVVGFLPQLEEVVVVESSPPAAKPVFQFEMPFHVPVAVEVYVS